MLDCSNMNLKHVPVGTVKDTRIRILSLRRNNIKAVNELDVIRAYPRLMYIDLRENPLSCPVNFSMLNVLYDPCPTRKKDLYLTPVNSFSSVTPLFSCTSATRDRLPQSSVSFSLLPSSLIMSTPCKSSHVPSSLRKFYVHPSLIFFLTCQPSFQLHHSRCYYRLHLCCYHSNQYFFALLSIMNLIINFIMTPFCLHFSII